MSGKSYIGVNGIVRENKKIYVGVNNVAREVKKAYVGINGIAKEIYSGRAKPLKIRITYDPAYMAKCDLNTPDDLYKIYSEYFYLKNKIFDIEYDPNTGIISGVSDKITLSHTASRTVSSSNNYYIETVFKGLNVSGSNYTCEIIDPGSMNGKNFRLDIKFLSLLSVDGNYSGDQGIDIFTITGDSSGITYSVYKGSEQYYWRHPKTSGYHPQHIVYLSLYSTMTLN